MQSIKKAKKTTAELRRNRERQIELNRRGKLILRKQSELLCQALKQLKRRSDMGNVLSTEIWEGLIEGITDQLPMQFFNSHPNYFWDKEEALTESEQALKLLLDQALQKKKAKEKLQKSNKGPGPSRSSKAVSSKSTQTPIFRYKAKANPPQSGKEEDESDELMGYLINVIKIAIEMTNGARWEWKQGFLELREELQVFHQGLLLAMQLFEELRHNPDLDGLISAIERLAIDHNSLPSDLSSDEERETTLSQIGCYGDTSSFSSEDEGSYYNTENVYVEDEEQDLKSSVAEYAPPINELCATEVNEPTPGNEKKIKQYLVRHPSDEKGRRKSIAFKCAPCAHIGSYKQASHGRDWKNDGFWCYCGKQFRKPGELERHLDNNTDASVLLCNKCEYTVNRRCCMDTHTKDIHGPLNVMKSSRRLYKCPWKCGKIFEKKGHLMKHHIIYDRQCLYENAEKLPVRPLPAISNEFINMIKGSLQRSGLELNLHRMDVILAAATAILAKRRNDMLVPAQKQEKVTDKKSGNKK